MSRMSYCKVWSRKETQPLLIFREWHTRDSALIYRGCGHTDTHRRAYQRCEVKGQKRRKREKKRKKEEESEEEEEKTRRIRYWKKKKNPDLYIRNRNNEWMREREARDWQTGRQRGSQKERQNWSRQKGEKTSKKDTSKCKCISWMKKIEWMKIYI